MVVLSSRFGLEAVSGRSCSGFRTPLPMTGQSDPSLIQPAHKYEKKTLALGFETILARTGIVGFRQGYLRKLPMQHAILHPCNYLETSPIIFPCSCSPRIDIFASVALHGPMLLYPSLICNAARNPRAFRSTARFSGPNPRGFLSDSSVDNPRYHRFSA